MIQSGKRRTDHLVADFKCRNADRNLLFSIFTYERSTESRLNFLIFQKELDYMTVKFTMSF